MKHLAILITIFLFSSMIQAQKTNEPYELLWKKVEKLEAESLTKSALEVVNEISERAKKEENAPQTVKALLYSSKYAMLLEEDAQLAIITTFKSEIERAAFPTKNVLESYLANLYWQYFQQNRYRFYDRTTTETKVDTTDFRTWDLATLFHEVTLHFDRSLQNENGLQRIPVKDFDLLLHEQENSEVYRPTLFDLLAHTALDFYKSAENSITRPADKFEIDDPELLCSAAVFTQRQIDSQDDTSLQARALQLFQKLVALHSPSKGIYTLAEVDLERLKFIYANAVFDGKEEHYIEVLKNSASALKDTPASGLYLHEIASTLQQQGNSFVPESNESVRWKLKEALEVCENVIKTLPDSRGSDRCKALKIQLLSKNLQLTTERYVPTESPSRLLVSYKNHYGLDLTARAITKSQLKQLERLYPMEKKLAFIKKLPIEKKWETGLRNEGDYQNHSTEIAMPSLKNGRYLILAVPKSRGKEPSKTGTFSFSTVQVTNIALLETRTATHHTFQAVDRNTGKPLAGALALLEYQQNYDGPYRKKNMTTDANGFIRIPLTDTYWNNVTVKITHAKEVAFFNEFYIDQKYGYEEPKTDYATFLFTDRSIYRPGQPLYFKGIAIKRTQEKSTVLENTTVTVTLKDVNSQEVNKQTFKTNEYGSFSGELILPTNGLTGVFTLDVTSEQYSLYGSTSFSVEEYKRPKFETSFEPVTESFKVNDTIAVSGKAMAYAGSAITDAKVVYSVKRIVSFPRWYSWYRPYFPGNPQEIAQGETVTNASGRYTINFKALPDKSVPRTNLPTFSYEVTADVTDLNGETHSTTTVVRVGYHTMTASIYVSTALNKDKGDHAFTIATTNLNGQYVPAKGTLKMYKLQAPESVLRPRPWPAPDYAGFTKEEFREKYPHDAYKNEHQPSQWKKGPLVWETDFDTEKDTKIALKDIKKWLSGRYVIELETRDDFGQVVKDIAQTALFSAKDKTLADNQLFRIRADKDVYAVGDKVEITLASNADDLHVTVFVEKNGEIVDTRTIKLQNGSKSFTVPVLENDLGGFGVSYSFSAFNALRTGNLPIAVPYPNTDLQIETLTFRDKMRPGTDERWTFKIKGPKGEQVSAEILASMYDASLDAFRGHYWSFSPLYRPSYYSKINIRGYQSYGIDSFQVYRDGGDVHRYKEQRFDSFNWFGLHFGYGGGGYMNKRRVARTMAAPMASGIDAMEMEAIEDRSEMDMDGGFEEETALEGNALGANRPEQKQENSSQQETTSLDDVPVRKNLQETAFFLPQLQTDKEGTVSFSFTTPEALTQWKLQLLAHNKALQSAYTTLQTVTQKELMVVPNAPRFLREGDAVTISTKIANLTDKTLSGKARLELVDALSGTNITQKLLTHGTSETEAVQSFNVDSLGNTQVSWKLHIPEGMQAVQYKVIASAGDFSDGEQNMLPVLTNRMLVTETLPMWVRGNQTKTFVLNKLKDNTSTTLRHHRLSLEVTSNPAWYAVQALPYLMEYPYECNEQTFARYYANTLASYIATSNPRIQAVFDQWRNSDALISDLEKNQELKSLLIQETPWLRDAQSETEQKKRIALLFNLDKMKREQGNALRKLTANQKSNGSWAWFNGGPDSRFITQHILTGLGHLKKLTATGEATTPIPESYDSMTKKAIGYLDSEFVKEYERMKKYASDINDDHLSQMQVHYLYMRSFFPQIKTSNKVNRIISYYKGQAQNYWVNRNLYSKGMLALILHRMGDVKTSGKIIRALEENSITSEELGMYWKENTASWYWYQAPIETQALLIEAFSEIQNDATVIDNLKIWLLKNKQTNQWKTTKATTDAIYALVLQGSDWLSVTEAVEVLVGGEKLDPTKLDNVRVEAGTGYFKTAWQGSEVRSNMAEVQMSKQQKGIAWGALYWQYFEDMDKITFAKTPLQLTKKLFLMKNTDTGEKLSEITDKAKVKVGDLVRVRIELRADRDMEFVHMKDLRAAGFEPINVISRYKWQDGLGYYESTKDASTNFFFDFLRKGVYVFEYDLRANNAGDFSNGITTIQSMYAPEFSSHSKGIRVKIENNF